MPISFESTRYFQLDTRDSAGSAQTMYAALRGHLAVLFTISDSGAAAVVFVIEVKDPSLLRATVQGSITDVVGISELADRPSFSDVQLGRYAGDAVRIGTIMDVGYE